MTTSPLFALLLAVALFAPAARAGSTEQASRYYEDALKRYERKDDAGAIIQLKNALKEEARMLPALVLLGQAHLRRGEPAAAERVFADAEKMGAARAQIAVYQARAYFDQGKYRALLEKFGADGLAPEDRLDLLLLRARAQMGLSQYDGAMTSARLAEQMRGGEVRALALQARIHLNTGRIAEARATVQRALQQAPRDGDALNVQASIAHVQGDLKTAAQGYGRTLAVQPDNIEARLARAAINLDLKRETDVLTDVEYLRKHAPADPRGAYLAAQYFARQGKIPAARDALRETVRTLDELSPEYRAANEQLQLLGGLAHHALGEYERARTYLGAYLEKRPREAGARKLMGSIHLAARQYDRAIAMLQPALRAHPDDARIKAMLGEAYMAKGDHGRATLLFQEAAQTGNTPDIQTGLGISLMDAGQKEAGFEALVRAWRQAPGRAQAGVPLALAHLRRGEAGQAAALMEAVLEREPRNLSARNLLGVARLAAGDRAGARAAYTEALRMAPGFHVAQLNLARLDEAGGQPDLARQRYRAILKSVPDHLDAMLELARLEEGAGRPQEAIRWIDKAVSLHGKDMRPRLAQHGLALRRGQPGQALEAARAAQAIAPRHPAPLLALAEAQLATGNAEQARTSLRRLTQVAAFDAGWLVRGAALQMRADDPDGAEYTLGKALLADPANRSARTLKIRLDLRQARYDEAERQIRALPAHKDGPADALRLTGELRLAQRRPGDAVEAYRKAYAAAPDRDGLFGLYGALMAAKRPAEAARLMTDWKRTHTTDPAVEHALGEAWLAQEDPVRAGAVYAALVRENDEDARAHNNLATILLRQGDRAGALAHAERARALAPDQPQVNDTLGWVLVQSGQIEKGLRYLREASLRAPDDPEIQTHLEQALRKFRR